MQRKWWLMSLLGVCLTASGWACVTALSEDEKPRGEAKADAPREGKPREGEARDGETRPRPPRPDGEREGAPPPRREGDRPEGGPPPRRGEGEGFGPGPRREGGPQGGPRDGEGRPPMPREGGPRDGEGRPPFGPGGPREGMGRPPFGPGQEPNFEHLREHDPEMYDLMKQDMDGDRDSRSLAEKIRKLATGAADRAKLETELKELVQKHFDVRQKRRELELKRVEDQLNRLRDSIKTRLEGRDDSIRRRIAELIGRPEDLGF